MRKALLFAIYLACALPLSAQVTTLPSRSGTILGPTGLFSVPTADVLTARKFQIGTHFGRDLSTVALNAGFANFVELGVSYLDRDDADNRTIANAKVQFIPTGFENLKIGVGVIDVAKAVERTGYIMLTTRAKVPPSVEDTMSQLILHAGYGTGLFREKIIGGAEGVLNAKWRVLIEYDGDNVNGGLRYSHDENLRLQAGVLRNQLFFSAGYTLEF
ncbi:MAG: hypothetical protein RMM06_01965 [Armatimonadota bacterium]|nr:hypothetical protein [bacterium]MCS7309533.1 hypothetical protein [Armatimonadota bacterium]MDW8105801.1 hypothetical protein [Armatimonadota bacterium]MDW8289463.1 hypothetical protein [Armatimonadota bacterium]